MPDDYGMYDEATTHQGGGVRAGGNLGRVQPSVPDPRDDVMNFPRAPADLSSEGILDLYRGEATGSIPQRQGFIDANLARMRSLAAGSPQALQEQLGRQLEAIQAQLDSTFTAISRRLGPSGGGQIERAKRDAVAGANQSLRQTLVGGQLQGVANLSQYLSGFRPVMAATLPQTVEQSAPLNLGPLYGQTAGSLVTAGQRLFAGTPTTGPMPSAPVSPIASTPPTAPPMAPPSTSPMMPSPPVSSGPGPFFGEI